MCAAVLHWCDNTYGASLLTNIIQEINPADGTPVPIIEGQDRQAIWIEKDTQKAHTLKCKVYKIVGNYFFFLLFEKVLSL